jgi:hypothetical protein
MENDRHQISTPLPGYGSALIDRINLYLKIRRYLNFIRERWLISMVFTTIGLGAGIWWAVTLPDQYVAESVLAFAPRIDVGIRPYRKSSAPRWSNWSMPSSGKVGMGSLRSIHLNSRLIL